MNNKKKSSLEVIEGTTAVQETLADCIAQTKGGAIPAASAKSGKKSDIPDWLGEAPDIPDSAIVDEWNTQLLIVGAGNAGLFAAAKAADLGLGFRIIESRGAIGDTRDFIGAINSKYTRAAGLKVDPGLWLSEFSRYSSGKCNQRVVKTFIDHSAEMIEYIGQILDAYGFDIEVTADKWPDMEHATPYYCPPQEHRTISRPGNKYSSWKRNDILVDYIKKEGRRVDFKTELVKLIKKGGAVAGAIAKTKKGYFKINAKNVLLATGGYESNDEMMVALQPLAARILVGSLANPSNKGQGIKAALWACADRDVEPAPMIFDRGIVKPGVDAGYQRQDDGCYTLPGGRFRTKTEYNPGTQPFLKVNRRGERFANESSPYNDIVYAASHQPGHVYCQVYDRDYRKYWEQFHTIGCSGIPRLIPDVMSKLVDHYVDKGIIQKANTLSELADKLGFSGKNKETFLATCNRQNENYDNGFDPDFYKPKIRLSPIRKPPFYGVWMGGNILCTGDGIKINEKMQALNRCEEIIAGLYCAGNAAGCFFAGNYPVLFPGISLGRAMTESLVAVKTIAGIS